MKKTILAIAIAGAVGAVGFSTVASAEATVYGRIVAGAIYLDRDKTNDDGAWNLGGIGNDGAGAPGSRFGFKGETDLGNGSKAGFKIERSLAKRATTDRYNNVYLSGSWGQLTLGQQDNPYINALHWDQTNFYGGEYNPSLRYEGINYSASTGAFNLNIMAIANDTIDPSSGTTVLCPSTAGCVSGATTAITRDTSGDDGVDAWIIHAGYDLGPVAVNFAHYADNTDVAITAITTAGGTPPQVTAGQTYATTRGGVVADLSASRDRTSIGLNGVVGPLDWYVAYETSELNASGNYATNDIESVGGFLGFNASEVDIIYGYYVAHSADRPSAATLTTNLLGEDFTETVVGYSREIGPGVKFIGEYRSLDKDLAGNNVGSDPTRLILALKLDF